MMWHEMQALWLQTLNALPLIGLGLGLFLVMYWLARPLSRLLVRPLALVTDSQLILVVVRRLVSVLIMLLGLYIFLRLAGLTQFAVAIVSGTGVMGLIIGFSFKDIAENFISSLLLSVQKPFKLDDVIDVAGQMGVVKQVTARATTLVDFDGNHIQIPNAVIYKSIIRNVTANPKVRGQFKIGIGYDSSIVEAQKIAMQIMQDADAVLDDPEPQVLVAELASSSVVLQVYYWVDGHQYALAKVSSMLMRLIMREFETKQISMPDDAREVIFPQGIVVHQSTASPEKSPSVEASHAELQATSLVQDQNTASQTEELSSDAQDIRKQARQAPTPEAGQNIL
ncbi:MAG: mechanosensitive ion channel family protein [Paraglaciecola sp.]|nr:mechanosensitive ion channel family protein [Paraglaciecola sp.]NCT48048.1 mechanosensitive ion channel family protein [Paraglaciecola sp.]